MNGTERSRKEQAADDAFVHALRREELLDRALATALNEGQAGHRLRAAWWRTVAAYHSGQHRAAMRAAR